MPLNFWRALLARKPKSINEERPPQRRTSRNVEQCFVTPADHPAALVVPLLRLVPGGAMPKDKSSVRSRIVLPVVLVLLLIGVLMAFRSLDLRYLLADEIDQEIQVEKGTRITLPGGEAKVIGLPAQVLLGDYAKRGTNDLNYFEIPESVSFYSRGHVLSLQRIVESAAAASNDSTKEGHVALPLERFHLKSRKAKSTQSQPQKASVSTEAALESQHSVWLCISKEPLLFVHAPQLILKSAESAPSHCFDLLDTEKLDRIADILIWRITVVTAYGVDVLEYPIEYLLTRKPLSFSVGTARFTIKPGVMVWKFLEKLPGGESIVQARSVPLQLDYAPQDADVRTVRILSYQ